MSIQSWTSTFERENLMTDTSSIPIENDAQHGNQSSSSESENNQAESNQTTNLVNNEIPAKDSIDSFEKFQQSNIMKLSEAIAGKSPQESIQYLNDVQEAFAFEIWERKEKSWSAELLKNQIKKSVDSEKTKILPSYDPSLLSKTSRPKKIKTSSEQSKDKTIAMFAKLGISPEDAQLAIKSMISQTYEMASAKQLPKVAEFKKCPKCSALNPSSLNECMICKTNIKECEYCKEFTSSKESKTCSEHKNEVK